MDCCKDESEIHIKKGNFDLEKIKTIFDFSDLKAKIVMERINKSGSCLATITTNDKVMTLTKELALNNINFEVKSRQFLK